MSSFVVEKDSQLIYYVFIRTKQFSFTLLNTLHDGPVKCVSTRRSFVFFVRLILSYNSDNYF